MGRSRGRHAMGTGVRAVRGGEKRASLVQIVFGSSGSNDRRAKYGRIGYQLLVAGLWGSQ